MSITLASLLTPEHVHPQFEGTSKKRLLENVASTIAADEDAAEQLLDGLQSRERLASTGVGQGIAIPHCRADTQDPVVHLFSLAEPVDFDALDGEPVDLLCVLVVPSEANETHLNLLREVIQVFSEPSAREPLTRAFDQISLHKAVVKLFEERV
ncbi:MAG: PTS sugar transporter subunit IIA [Litorivicinus sp.]